MDGQPSPRVTPDPAPPAAGGGHTGPWRAALHARLPARPLPLVLTPDALVPAATLWTGARRWTAWFRAHGVAAGDRVVCALPPGPGFVMVLVAALWDELTFVPVPAAEAGDGARIARRLARADARVAIVPPGTRAGPGVVPASFAGVPADDVAAALRPRCGPPTPAARFLLETSGTTGAPRVLALSDANVWAVLDSHRPHLALDALADAPATVLSVLPWHHAFGLVMELLPALLAGAELVRDPAGGRDPDALVTLAAAHPVTHLSAVPHTVRRLAEREGGRRLLGRLRGGVVGGAPADAVLAEVLRDTRLRAGYGQTEASPGVTLGDPGAWRAGALGRPLGCEVRLDADGVLAFRGPNACLGTWDPDGGLDVLAPDRWVRTGDLARREPDGTYTFEGRLADSFKLENGRWVPAAAVERRVRARWPHVTEALLSSPDGRELLLAVSTSGDTAPGLDPADLVPVLGPLAGRPVRVAHVPVAAWARTPKGELDRRFPAGRTGVTAAATGAGALP